MAGSQKDWEKKVILFKHETTEGVDAAPTSAANALKVLNLVPTFMDADFKVRAFDKNFFGANPGAFAAFKRGFSFDMLMHGGGAAATPPAWMIPAQIAGFGAPVIAANVTLNPLTTAIKTATMWAYIDDLLISAIGGRMNMGFKIEDDEDPIFNFTYLGRPPVSLASQAVPTAPTITGYVDPLISSTETTTFSFGAFAAPLRRCTMSANVVLEYRSLIGPADRVAYRNRSWSGEIVIQLPDLTAKDYFTNIRPGTTQACTIVQGTTAGNIVTISMPLLQTQGNATITEEQGIAMLTLPVTALPGTNGNDEISFVTS